MRHGGYKHEAALWLEAGEPVPGEVHPPTPRGEGEDGQGGQLGPDLIALYNCLK